MLCVKKVSMARLLIIEDNEVVRLTLRMMLEEESHTVFEAEDGDKGLQQFQTNPCPIVITDMRMPSMNGASVIESLLQLEPSPKIIAISGGDAGEKPTAFIAEAKAAGAHTALRKPVRMDDLSAAIATLL